MYSEQIDKISAFLDSDIKKYYKLKGEFDNLCHRKNELVNALEEIGREEDKLLKVKVVFQKASEHARNEAIKQIEYIVTQCLQYIFDTDINCKIDVTEKNGVAHAEIFIESNWNGYIVKTKPQESRGGGVIDIVSLSLRLAMLELNNPKIEGPLILDEPAKHVSEDFIANVGNFLKESSRTFDRQVIMVTHNNYLSELADKSFNVFIKDGESIIEMY